MTTKIPKLYHRALEIKAAKLKDVQELAVKYVPPEHIMWFYRQFEDNTNNNPDLSVYEYWWHNFKLIF